jgi:hypothetical protein
MALPFMNDRGANHGDAQARRLGVSQRSGDRRWCSSLGGGAPASTDDPVREFGAMTGDLNAMADWLLGCGSSTRGAGVHRYWIPVYDVLEQRGLTVRLVTRQMKYVRRKSDVQDCQWLQKLMSLGFLRAAWRPDSEVCVVRAVARQRDVLIAEQASGFSALQGPCANEYPTHGGAH